MLLDMSSAFEQMAAGYFDNGHPVSVDMQISFNLVDVNIVTNPECARHIFVNTTHLNGFNPNSENYFTIVIITNVASGVLGKTEFPFDWPESSNMQMVVVSSVGFKGFASRNQGDMTYDDGDTVVHESGHAFGLLCTFDGGCWGKGVWVEDTATEKFPQYACVVDMSCGQSDPVHNFMDYSPDVCMVGFSEVQKRRAHCILQHSRPTLYCMPSRAATFPGLPAYPLQQAGEGKKGDDPNIEEVVKDTDKEEQKETRNMNAVSQEREYIQKTVRCGRASPRTWTTRSTPLSTGPRPTTGRTTWPSSISAPRDHMCSAGCASFLAGLTSTWSSSRRSGTTSNSISAASSSWTTSLSSGPNEASGSWICRVPDSGSPSPILQGRGSR